VRCCGLDSTGSERCPHIVCAVEGEGFVDNLCGMLTAFQETQR
jgi:hypothetical protein